ncbi:MAG TPA: methionyl-tRNA formyltransferase [Candidatus Acidoferrales bacterium]|nr:methionyl-tRNA formyltransferase [Candidatus Acidoferrales bacterium]
MKILFCGTPDFAVPTLRRLHGEKFEIAAVVTQPDRPKGRGLEPAESPVKAAAVELGLRVEQPDKLKGEAGRALLERYQPDAVVIVGYGQIIPANLLAIPQHGWINLHGSLLPKYRGAAPVQWALINGETTTGVTTMRIDAGLDTGPIFLQREVEISDEDNAVTLAARLAELGAELMVESLRGIDAGTLAPKPQDNSKASKAPLLKKEHGKLDWSQPARAVFNSVRGLVPWPGAYTSFRGQLVHIWRGKPVQEVEEEEGLELKKLAGLTGDEEKRAIESAHQKVSGMGISSDDPGYVAAFRHALPWPTPGTSVVGNGLFLAKNTLYVACGENTWLRLEELQPANRKRMAASDFINGLHLHTGERFES